LTTSARPSALTHPRLLLVLLALAPLWLMGIFGRGLWTPDEPREADIAWRMSQQSDRTLPQLAGVPFLEKPPLSYWMSGLSIAAFGDSAAAARLPNVLYAALGALAVFALARALTADAAAALIAALIASSALLAWRVSVWLAPDAGLLAASSLALLGGWLGYRAPPGAAKLRGYLLMHLGAALGFMAKSAPGWLVPALALLTLIAWERRFMELRRWELYAGLALQALIIGPWVLAVAHGAHGAEALRTLFWNNLAGRFTQVAAPAGLDYTTGHHNRPGKYLLELPLYLLPWTLIVAAALRRAATRARAANAAGSPWRYALASSVPFLVLLSLAATARDVYAAPALPGLALLTALWVHGTGEPPDRIDQLALQTTRGLVLGIAWILGAALLVLGATGSVAWLTAVAGALLAVACAHGASARAAAAQGEGDVVGSLGWTYTGYVAALCVASLVAFPVIDRWQNLSLLAQRIHADSSRQALALLDPDETTIAMLDRGLATPFTVIRSAPYGPGQAISRWWEAHPANGRVLVLLPGHAGGDLTRFFGRFTALPPAPDGVAEDLTRAGTAVIVERYQLPQGRRYALLEPPPAH
jgi:4-amino-4-deoxy-L-arabinose transferase-like glycosyltransferase